MLVSSQTLHITRLALTDAPEPELRGALERIGLLPELLAHGG
jgi:hypothetical protein